MAGEVHPRDTATAMAVRLALIEERNVRSDRDKAWERSWFRRLFIMMIIYAAASLFLMMIHIPNFYFAAGVPPMGFLISNLTLPALKNWWVHACYHD